MYAIAALLSYSPVGFASLVIVMYLLLLSNSYGITLYTARLDAWIGKLGR